MPDDSQFGDQARWTFGCLVGAAAMIGTLTLVALVAFLLEPPQWVNILLGLALVAGGGALTWLVVTALAQSKTRGDQRPRPVDDRDEP